MTMKKCPFCGEIEQFRNAHGNGYYSRYRCGTQGPDINGEYDVGHTCDITTWTRLLAEKDAEIARLSEQLKLITEGVNRRCGVGPNELPLVSVDRLVGEIARLQSHIRDYDDHRVYDDQLCWLAARCRKTTGVDNNSVIGRDGWPYRLVEVVARAIDMEMERLKQTSGACDK
jgi:hypothetical protein